MNDNSVRLLSDLLKIYSPSGQESRIADFLVKELSTLGFDTKKDIVGNVIAEIGQGEIAILLCGHIDTVTGNIPVKIENKKVYGRGAVDAKGSMAAMILAVSAITKEMIPPAKIIVAGVVDEEGNSTGIKHLINEGLEADYAIFGEPSGVDNLTIGYKGSIHLKISFKTQTGHSSAPWLYQNAIEKAFQLWEQIKYNYPIRNLDSPYQAITPCLIKIRGGQTNSTVPSKCEMRIDIRFPRRYTPEQVFAEISNTIREFQFLNPQVSVSSGVLGSTPAFEVDKKSLLVRALSWSIRKTRKKSATLLRKTGTGDMNLLGQILNVPTVTYGPGDSRLDHTPNEFIEIDEYLDSIQIYKNTILRLVELHKKNRESD